MYGAPAWQPWLAATRLEQLERCQNRALRVITGQLQTTPVKTLKREMSMQHDELDAPADRHRLQVIKVLLRVLAHRGLTPQCRCIY